jgi:hypothetical protein
MAPYVSGLGLVRPPAILQLGFLTSFWTSSRVGFLRSVENVIPMGAEKVLWGVLSQVGAKLMTTAGGFQTSAQDLGGSWLRHFYGFGLLDDARGRSSIADQQLKFVEVANGFGMINEGPPYRASRDRGAILS